MELTIFCMIIFSLVSFSQQKPDYRLPNDSVPINYELNFEIQMDDGELLFNGGAKIFLEVLKPTVNLTMHAHKLNFNESETKLLFGNETFTPEKHIFVPKHQFLILNFREYLKPGRYNLSLEYAGEPNYYGSNGIFYDTSSNEEQTPEFIVATHFEPNFAHRVFPCWDEPALKATFDISIKHLSNYTALSNMPVKKVIDTTAIDKKKWTFFETTPLMSTYLVAFTLSRFVNVTNPQGNISLWVSKEYADKSLDLSYETILKAFSVMENYTNIQYHLPKIDIFSLAYYAYKAMENWGLIIVTDEHLLVNNKSDPRDALTLILNLQHEVVHQWFGNLVSPNWWTDVWITEGITQYFQSHLFSKTLNDSKLMDWTFINGHLRATIDHSRVKLPLGNDLELLPNIMNLLTESHDRGAGLMRMLSGLITEEVFNGGVKTLLDRYKFKSISTDDFWNIMQESLNQSQVPYFDIKEKLDPFVLQAGLSLVNVRRNYKTGVIRLAQKCIHGNRIIRAQRWIPINYGTYSSSNFSLTQSTLWMNPNENETIIRGIDPNDLVIFNIEGIAPYVVNYGNKGWEKIADCLKSNNFCNINPLNRAKLLLDAYWSFKRGKIYETLYKSLLEYLKNERELIPWVVADYTLKTLRNEENFIMELYTPLLNYNNTSDDSFSTRYKNQIAFDKKYEYDRLKAFQDY